MTARNLLADCLVLLLKGGARGELSFLSIFFLVGCFLAKEKQSGDAPFKMYGVKYLCKTSTIFHINRIRIIVSH